MALTTGNPKARVKSDQPIVDYVGRKDGHTDSAIPPWQSDGRLPFIPEAIS